MKKVDISDVLYRHRRKLLITLPIVAIIAIWSVGTIQKALSVPAEELHSKTGLLVQLALILSIVAYPTWILFWAIIISNFKRLKPQSEGGLISDSLDMLTSAGPAAFVAGILFAIIGGKGNPFQGLELAIMCWVLCTPTAFIMSFYIIYRELSRKKYPVEHLGSYPATRKEAI